jgi:hypothetical protein
MRGRLPEGHITAPRNTRMEETRRKQRRMEAPSEGGPGPEGAVAPQMDGWMYATGCNNTFKCMYNCVHGLVT